MSLYYHPAHPSLYPKRKYSLAGGSVLVQNSVEEAQLGAGWTDSPVVAFVPEEVQEPEPVPVKRGPGRPRKEPLA